MDKGNLPNHKPSAKLMIAGMKVSFVEIVEMLANNELTSVSQISGHCWSQIEALDDILEGYHE